MKLRGRAEFGAVFLQGGVVISAASHLIEVVMQEVLVQFWIEFFKTDAGKDIYIPRVVTFLALVDIPYVKSFFLCVDAKTT